MQKEKTVFYKSALAASALFVTGNAIIILPTNENYPILGFLLTAVIGVILNLLLMPLSRFVWDENNNSNTFLKILKELFFLSLAIAALFAAADTLKDFVHFVKGFILPEIPIFVISVTFSVIIAYFYSKRQEDTLKFSLLCFFFTLLAVLFFFFSMSGNFDVQNIIIRSLPDIRELKDSISPYFFKATLPSLLLPFYHTAVFGKRGGSACVLGTAAGYIILCLCLLPSILLFSAPLAGKLSYPYASAISTVTVGKIFTRLDGFSYFLYFSASLAKINISLFVVKKAVNRISELLDS